RYVQGRYVRGSGGRGVDGGFGRAKWLDGELLERQQRRARRLGREQDELRGRARHRVVEGAARVVVGARAFVLGELAPVARVGAAIDVEHEDDGELAPAGRLDQGEVDRVGRRQQAGRRERP